ncbi:hypothetical protein LRS10_09520 [Phenylobacterium sp. J426]|uniref:hypothetical protein n=1 Tax=Phenylobacterium sp. J426 TaxID=2898439 RepID=UPI002151C708|nr:hypothetical protein [Phenylobacterium sp. J426]MCR5874381.1 hypothetical protein [Phenylobacterium sp. J426]
METDGRLGRPGGGELRVVLGARGGEGQRMPNFLVRIIDSKEAVGIFAVSDIDDLFYWIDEVTDVSACEFAEIGSGSIIWEGPAKAIPVDLDEMPDDNDPTPVLDSIGEHALGGMWFNGLTQTDLEFTPCADVADIAANDP